MDTLINKVANSGLITINLEDFYPSEDILIFDIKDYLYMELILKEKNFRKALKEHDWSQYEGGILLVNSSTDAIIPLWASMLITAYAAPYAKELYYGTQESYLTHHYNVTISKMDLSSYGGSRIVIKGCSSRPVPAGAYMALTEKLRPYAQSIMFGEPCSTVPIFKRPRKINI